VVSDWGRLVEMDVADATLRWSANSAIVYSGLTRSKDGKPRISQLYELWCSDAIGLKKVSQVSQFLVTKNIHHIAAAV
jgi:hypothetical protein